MSPRNQYQPAVSSNSDLDARLRGLPVIGENETALSGTTCSTDTGRLSTLFSPNRAMPSATPPMSVGSSIGSAESKLLVVRNRFRRAPTSKTSTHAHSEAGKVAAALYEVQSEYEERGGCPAMRRTDGWVVHHAPSPSPSPSPSMRNPIPATKTNAWSKLKFWKVAAKAEGATQDMPKAVVPQLYDLQRAPAQYPQFDALL